VHSTTYRLDADFDPVTLGARSGLLWARDGFGLAGLGQAAVIPYGPGSAAAATNALAELTGQDEVNTAGTGAVAFGALPFDPQLTDRLVVPNIVVGRAADGRRWLTVMDGSGLDDAMAHVQGVLDRPVPSGPEPSSFRLDSSLAPEIWRDEVVGFARDRIRAGDLTKAVLARELRLRTDHPIDTAVVIDRLRTTFPAAILFSVDGFVGASPELLVARDGDVVRAHPLAGTAPRSSDPSTDAAHSAGLLGSKKDRWEHRITIDWLLDTLLPFCSYVDAEPEPTIVTLANVHHLGTRVEGRLSSPASSVLELVAALHPTPAVGGQPQKVALDLIEGLERADRGRYAGPCGWVDGAGNGAFAVSVRSAEISGTEARIFAGVGVVADSDPEAELAETRSKFQAMLGALIRP
jgi:menaquinone-specific isochorismate synthase